MGSCCCSEKSDESKAKKGPIKKNEAPEPLRTPSLKLKSKPLEKESEPKSPNDSNSIEGEKKKKKNESGYGKNAQKEVVISNSDDETEKKLITDEKLKESLKNTVKGGDSAYGKVKRALRKKSLSDSQYNKQGLVDTKSKEFEFVKEFMASKKYDVSVSIGSGSYAEVYKAFSREKKRWVAVKVIDLTKANENYRNNFLPREIKVLSKLKHPAIIKIYEISQTNNRIFMVMEFAAEGTFADWLKNKGSMNESLAWIMFKQVFDALNQMHRKKIAHRDLKLENILVTSKLHPKISDFSYAIICEGNDETSETFCGSLPYFSPEILQRKPHNPLASDVWSIGVCMYIMLNDTLPFKIGDDKAMLHKQLSRECKFRNKVEAQLSPELKTLVRRMLEPDANMRITMEALVNDQWIITDHSKN